MYQFLHVFRTQIADQLGRLLDPYPIALLFVCFLSLDTPPLAPLPPTHHRQQLHVLVWCDSPSVASTGPIFKCREIVNFVTSMFSCNQRPHKLIKTHRNDTKNNMKQLLDLIYTGVSLGGMDSLLPVPALLISAILHLRIFSSLADITPALLISAILHLRISFSLADIFAYTCLMSLFFCFFARQLLRFEGVPSLPPATSLPLLSNLSPPLSSLLLSSTLPFCYPPPALAVAALPIPGRIIDIEALRGAVPPPPRERGMWALAMGKEGGNVTPHAQL